MPNLWNEYISQKKKLITSLDKVISIEQGSCEIKNGVLFAKLKQTATTNNLINLIKETFQIEETDIFLSEGYILVPNDKEISNEQLDDFKIKVKSFYIDFIPKLALEIVIKNILLNKFLSKKIKIDEDGIAYLSKEQIVTIQEQYKENIVIENMTCLYSVQRTGNLFIRGNNLYFSKGGLENVTLQNEYNFSIKYDHNKIHTQAIPINFYNRITTFYNFFFYKIILYFEYTKLNYQDVKEVENNILIKFGITLSFSLVENLIITLEVEQYYIGEIIDYIYLFLNNIDENFILDHSQAFFYSQIPLLKVVNFDELTEKIPHARYQKRNTTDIVLCDFENIDEVDSIKNKLLSIKGLEVSDYGDNHKFKVKLQVHSPFKQIEQNLKRKDKSIFYWVNTNKGEIKTVYFYDYNSEDKAKYIIDFRNTIDSILESGFTAKEDENKEFKHKFIIRVNKDHKLYEENSKFDSLLNSPVKVDNNTIGVLRKVDYPNIQIKLNENSDSLDLQSIEYIQPDLTGEIEKVSRLDDTLTRLKKNEKLVNPKISDFIFDATEASPLIDDTILDPNSKEFKEIKYHQNPNSHLNDSQIRGVVSSLHAKDLVIIQGPPGTGKSTAISEIIWHHLRINPNQKLLVTSESHLAVDNALDKLGKFEHNLIKPVRFGVHNDIFDEFTQDVQDSKIENEGKRFSYRRFHDWVESNEIENDTFYKILKENAVQEWANNIAKRSKRNNDNEKVNAILSKWHHLLENPNTEMKKILCEEYMDKVNVVGGTSSSISEVKFTKKILTRDKEVKYRKGTFLEEYQIIFPKEDLEEKEWQRYDNDWTKADKDKQQKEEALRIKMYFDVVITDEASKATPPELALPMVYGKKNIIVGDHRQLPPSLDEEDFIQTLEDAGEHALAKFFKSTDINKSHFEDLFVSLGAKSSIRTTFDRQYRMHSSINDVISQFYEKDGGLYCGLDPNKENIPDLTEPQSRWHGLSFENFIEPDTHCIWVNVETPEVKEGVSRMNYGEIDACEKVIQILQNSEGFDDFQNFWKKEEDKEIGLISFYGGQVRKLHEMTKNSFPNLPIRVKTVDKFQGMERNLLIVSLVRSNNIAEYSTQPANYTLYPEIGYPPQHSLGFAILPNRLNVALSRAKRLLVIVGNAKHFSQKEMYRNVYNTISNSPNGKIINIQDFIQ